MSGSEFVDRGQGANVLGGPVSALLHFIRGPAGISGEWLKPGDIVTTGTVTRAFPSGRARSGPARLSG